MNIEYVFDDMVVFRCGRHQYTVRRYGDTFRLWRRVGRESLEIKPWFRKLDNVFIGLTGFDFHTFFLASTFWKAGYNHCHKVAIKEYR